jgi:hypothetical protein
MTNIVFETWNKDEVSYQKKGILHPALYIARIKNQIFGTHTDSYTKHRTIGVFMYQEIIYDTLRLLNGERNSATGERIEIRPHTNKQVYDINRLPDDGAQTEIYIDTDYIEIYVLDRTNAEKRVGHFVKQKSWNNNWFPEDRSRPFNQQDLRLNSLIRYKKQNNISGREETVTEETFSYNGIVWSPEIISKSLPIIPLFFDERNEFIGVDGIQYSGKRLFGYRTSHIERLEYMGVTFHAISIHGIVPKDTNYNKFLNFCKCLNNQLYNYPNIVLGGDFNMTPVVKQKHSLFQSFATVDLIDYYNDKKKIHEKVVTTFNDSDPNNVFEEKIDWIFFRLNPEHFELNKIIPYVGDIDLVKEKKNQSDHVRVNITVSLKNTGTTRASSITRNQPAISASASPTANQPAISASASSTANTTNQDLLREWFNYGYQQGYQQGYEEGHRARDNNLPYNSQQLSGGHRVLTDKSQIETYLHKIKKYESKLNKI